MQAGLPPAPDTRAPTRRDLLALGAGALFGSGAAFAQDTWPSKPLRMIIPAGAGSGGDILGRIFCERLAIAIKQPVVVDNKPGANGILAADILSKLPGDGYSFGWFSSSSTVINQALQPNLPFNVATDMVPIVQVGRGGIHLVVSPDFPAKNLQEVVAVVKAHPGKYNYGSWGIGSTGHLMGEWLKSQAKLDITHVPYKTMPQVYQDLQGGNLQIAWVDASSSIALIKAGKLRGIAITGTRRGPALPDLPTVSEQGYRFETDAWYGVFAPKGVPANVVNTINRVIREALVAPELQERLIAVNLADTPPRSPEEFAKVVRDDLKVWQELVRANNIKIDS